MKYTKEKLVNLIQEHQRIVKKLRTGKGLKKEAQIQNKELQEYKRKKARP